MTNYKKKISPWVIMPLSLSMNIYNFLKGLESYLNWKGSELLVGTFKCNIDRPKEWKEGQNSVPQTLPFSLFLLNIVQQERRMRCLSC